MRSWAVYSNLHTVEILPCGEEEFHEPGFGCECFPDVKKDFIDERLIYIHHSFDGRELLEDAYDSPYHTVRQKLDC